LSVQEFVRDNAAAFTTPSVQAASL
jgi:hypothetical protein